jgi:preprotein translocase SecE subunit
MAQHRQRRDDRSEEERELEAEVRDEALLGETEPADPLGQALPDVTEARRAEEGPDPTPVEPVAPRRASGGRQPEPAHEHEHVAHPRKGLFGRAADFLRACVAELRRVQWPDRRQVGQGTAVVIGFVLVAGAYLGVLDAIWNPIVQAIL